MILYLNIAKAVALRSNQLGDAEDAADFNALYDGDLETAMEGTDLPFPALKQQILASEKRVASFLARLRNPLFYGSMLMRTGGIADNGEISSVSDTGIEFIGRYVAIRDSENDEELTEKPKQEVRRLRRLIDGGFLTLPTYHYSMSGKTLNHTRQNVYMEGLGWDLDTQSAAYDEEDGNSPLPQECEVMLAADVLANLAQEEWFVAESARYSAIVAQCKADMEAGQAPSASLPDTTANAEPVKN